MSVTVNFYKNLSDRRVAEKVLELVSSKSCNITDDISVINPVLTVEGDLATWSQVNYMTVPAFNRSYFITVTNIGGGQLQINGTVDVLSSCIGYIQGRPAVVRRSENFFNLYLADGTFKAYANERVQTKSFSAGFSTPAYVLVLSGG